MNASSTQSNASLAFMEIKGLDIISCGHTLTFAAGPLHRYLRPGSAARSRGAFEPLKTTPEAPEAHEP